MPFCFSNIFAVSFLLLSIILVYWRGLDGAFFFDDIPNLVQANEIQISSIDVDTLYGVARSGHAGPLGRPISLISFAFNFYVCGMQAYCFKLVNLLIHCINSLLVAGLLYLVVLESKIAKPRNLLLLLVIISLFWALHPIQVTSVLYVVQRMTSLSSLFVLVGVVLHIYSRQSDSKIRARITLLAAWFIAFPLALLSKETGVLQIGYVLCYEAILRPGQLRRWDGFGRLYVISVSAALAISLIYFVVNPEWLLGGYLPRPFTLSERLITELRVLWEYVKFIFLPQLPFFSLHHDDIYLSNSLLEPITGLIALVSWLILFLVIYLQRRKRPLIAFALAWFVVGHSLESTIIPLELMHEHRNYLPSLILPFIALNFIGVLAVSESSGRVGVIWGLMAFMVYAAVLTHLRSDMYGDEYRRTQVEVQYHPNSVRANYDAGALLLNIYHSHSSPELLSSANHFLSKASELDINFKMALVAQMQLECFIGKSVRIETIDELKKRLSNGYVGVHERSTMAGIASAAADGSLCLDSDDFDRMFQSFLANPMASSFDKAKALNVYGYYVWTQEGDGAKAMQVFDEAIELNDIDVANRINKIQLLRWFGDRDGIRRQIPHIESRKLNREETAQWNSLREQLVKDKVLGE